LFILRAVSNSVYKSQQKDLYTILAPLLKGNLQQVVVMADSL